MCYDEENSFYFNSQLGGRMQDLVKKTLVVCAAISGFGGAVYLGDSVLGSYIRAKQVADQNLAASESGSGENQPPAAVDTAKPKASFSFQFGK